MAPGRHPALVLLLAVALAILSIWAATRSHPSASIQDLLGKNDPAATAIAHLMRDFSSAEELLVLVSVPETASLSPSAKAPVVEGDRSDPERLLEFAASLQAALRQSPKTAPLCAEISYAAGNDFMAFFTREAIPAGLLYLDKDEYRAFVARLTPDSMRRELEQDESMMSAPGPVANALMKDPLRLRDFLTGRLKEQTGAFKTFEGRPEFISPDGKSLLFRIAGVKPPSDLDFAKLLTAQVQEVARAIPARGLQIDFAGAYAIAAASERAIRADLTESIVWSIVIMQAVFLLGYRSLLSFPIAIIPVALGLALAFGIHATIASGFTPLTAAIGAMLVGCGIDYPIYFISNFEAARARGLAVPQARESALRVLAVPLIAACATSVAGFTAIGMSGIQALRDFALLGGLGLIFALAGAVWILPAMLTLATRAGLWGGAGPRLGVGRLIRSVCAKPKVFLAACAIVAVASAVSFVRTGGVQFETDLHVMHPAPNPPLETQELIGKKFGAVDSMIVYFEAPTASELVAIAYRVQLALRSPQVAAAGISGSVGLPMFLPDPAAIPARAAEMSKLDPDRIIAEFDAEVRDTIFDPAAFDPFKAFLRRILTNTTGPSLEILAKYPAPFKMLVGANTDGRHSAVTFLSLDSTAHSDSRDAAVISVRAALKPVPEAVLTGLGVVGYDVARSVREDLPRITIFAAIAIITLLLVSLRSIRDSALALIPVAFGMVCLLGYMSVTGERLNMASALALPLLAGIGVDYGIFEVSMSQQARRAGEGADGLLTRIAASLHAMLLSATTNVIGFGTLAFTSVPAVQSLGRVITIGVLACMAGTLLILAPILVARAKRDKPAFGPTRSITP